MKRVRENKKIGKRVFARTARKTKKLNVNPVISRGGIRL